MWQSRNGGGVTMPTLIEKNLNGNSVETKKSLILFGYWFLKQNLLSTIHFVLSESLTKTRICTTLRKYFVCFLQQNICFSNFPRKIAYYSTQYLFVYKKNVL